MFFDVEDFDKVNQHTWCIDCSKIKKEYATTNIKQISGKYKKKSAHRLLINEPKDLQVDHINGNTFDNRKSNLRIVTQSVNQHNRITARGYYWSKQTKRWKAQIRVNKKVIYVGSYNTEAEARTAYLEAKKKYHLTAPIHFYK
jgi:hypothetical protein